MSGAEDTFTWPETCPVTVVGDAGFSPAIQTPRPLPEMYEAVWYGTPELYTMLGIEGRISLNRWLEGEKTLWWSEAFSISAEPTPGVEVIARRLDELAAPVGFVGGSGANEFLGRSCWSG